MQQGRTSNNYKPRNIINAPAIKAAILTRSIHREDSETLTRWLTNHFYRWAIGDFPQVVPVITPIDYATCFGSDAEIPDWLAPHLSDEPSACGETPFYYLNANHPQLLARENELVEFLSLQRGTRLENKLQRINCFTAMAMREEEHKRMQQRSQKSWRSSTASALQSVMITQSGEFFEFLKDSPDLRQEMTYESWHMQHCVGQFIYKKLFTGGYGEYYAERIETGQLRLFTLRDSNNIPHVTVSLIVNGDTLEIDQIKGKQNRPPVKKYTADVLRLLRHLSAHPEQHADCEEMGIVYESTQGHEGWKFVHDIHDTDFLLKVLHQNFSLLTHIPEPPVAVQWLLLQSRPEQLRYLQSIDPCVATAADMLFPDQQWHPTLRDKNRVDTPFTIENIPLQAPRYLSTEALPV